MYVIPILCILLVLPLNKVTGIGGFIDAVTLTFHGVYGGAAHALLVIMTLCFIGALVTSGAVWMIGSDRIQAVAAYDGAFFPFFGVFNRRLGTPVRVNVLSGIASTVFCDRRDLGCSRRHSTRQRSRSCSTSRSRRR